MGVDCVQGDFLGKASPHLPSCRFSRIKAHLAPIHRTTARPAVRRARRILPKVEDEATLRACLALLSGRRHRVFTGVALALPGGGERSRVVETMIAMKRLSDEEMAFYAAHGEWRGKAGGYALQGYGGVYVRHIAGSYSNVVGLPLAETRHLLKSAGYDLAWWLIEQGIGETRTVLVEDGEIIEARILRDGVTAAGTVLAARLISAGRNAIARAGREEFLLPKGAPRFNEGAAISIEVTREALGGAEPWKRPLARMTDAPRASPAADRLNLVHKFATDTLEAVGWSDIIDEARSGIIAFPGGELRVTVTPAMTLIDVDGNLPPERLALAGAKASARHPPPRDRRLIGRLADHREPASVCRRGVDAILPQPFERTAVNGFGFIQIVRPRRHQPDELAADRAAFEARALLRRAAARRERSFSPLIQTARRGPTGMDRAARHQIGGAVSLRPDPSLAMRQPMPNVAKKCPLCGEPAPSITPSAVAAARIATCWWLGEGYRTAVPQPRATGWTATNTAVRAPRQASARGSPR
ncbi:MAG: Maf family protein [Bryobacteraceae bacterium]